MSDMHALLGAGIAVWLGLGAYVAYLLRAQNRLERRMRRLETGDE